MRWGQNLMGWERPLCVTERWGKVAEDVGGKWRQQHCNNPEGPELGQEAWRPSLWMQATGHTAFVSQPCLAMSRGHLTGKHFRTTLYKDSIMGLSLCFFNVSTFVLCFSMSDLPEKEQHSRVGNSENAPIGNLHRLEFPTICFWLIHGDKRFL